MRKKMEMKEVRLNKAEFKQALKRIFNGMEIKDAKAMLYLNATLEDMKNAKPRDLQKCVFAQTIRRTYGSTTVVFARGVAYLDMEDEDGVRKCFRFIYGTGMKDAIWDYDKSDGKKFKPGVYRLLPPPKSQTLNQKLKDARERRALHPEKYREYARRFNRKKAIIKAKAKAEGKPTPRSKTLDQTASSGYLRSGTGLIQTRIK
jgi:hypothetical protein